MDGYDLTIVSDGYNSEVIARFAELDKLCDKQENITKELTDLTDEMDNLPSIPESIDYWIDSVADPNSDDNFKMSDFSKMFKMNKKYNNLIEEKDKTSRKMKILVIDNLLDKIKGLIGE
jgi:hypothetical protein